MENGFNCTRKRTILFVVNPVSGGKDKTRVLNIIRKKLDNDYYSYDFYSPSSPDAVVSRVRESEADIIVAVGGDGTVNLVAQGVIGTNKVMGIIPCGSGNGLALHLGISLRVRKALRILLDEVVNTIDYGMINGHPFLCTAGVGLDASVATSFALQKKRGLKSYAKLTWKLLRHVTPVLYTITVDDEVITVPALDVTVGNANQWGNHAKITPLASVKDGLLDVVIILRCKVYDIPSIAAKIMNGRLNTSHHAIMFRGQQISIIRQTEGPAHFDGEPCLMGKQIDIEIVPSSLKIVVPGRGGI